MEPSSSAVSPFAKIPLPGLEPFNKGDVAKWFKSLATQFLLCRANTELDKYVALLGYLEPSLRTIVQDWVAEERKVRTVNDPFSFAQGKLILRFQPSEKERLVKLMCLRPSSGMLPSEYLKELLAVATEKHETVAREIWEDFLPEAVTAMLQTPQIQNLSLEAKAVFADGFHLANKRRSSQLDVAADTFKPQSSSNMPLSVAAVDTLTDRMNALEATLKERKKFFPAKKRVAASSARADLCWYHRRFGDQAKKCLCVKNE